MATEPSPRFAPFSATVEGQLCVWGGLTEDRAKDCDLHIFGSGQERWERKLTTGPQPPGFYSGAASSLGHHLYAYGGTSDGSHYHSSLHQLDTRTATWTQLSSEGPMKKSGCSMVAHEHSLLLIGGRDGRDIHMFDLQKGEDH